MTSVQARRRRRPSRTLRCYRPDVVSLACSKVAAARKQTGLPVAAFAAALEPLLGWSPAPDPGQDMGVCSPSAGPGSDRL